MTPPSTINPKTYLDWNRKYLRIEQATPCRRDKLQTRPSHDLIIPELEGVTNRISIAPLSTGVATICLEVTPTFMGIYTRHFTASVMDSGISCNPMDGLAKPTYSDVGIRTT